MRCSFVPGGAARGRLPLALPLALAALLVVLVSVPAWAIQHGRRDPFHSLIPAAVGKGQRRSNRPPGRAGLEIDRMTIQAVAIGGPTGPVALVADSSGATYFLRPGEQIFDGVVLRLTPNGMWFRRTRSVAIGQSVGAKVFRGIDPQRQSGEGK